MKLLYSILFLVISLSGFAETKIANDPYNQKMIDLYKTVKHKDHKVFYEFKIYNGACNYEVWLNDLPVTEMRRNARGEITVPINGKILKSGKQQLRVKIFPFYDENRNLKTTLNKYAGIDITVNKQTWNAEKKNLDVSTVFNYQTPREGKASLKEKPAKLLTDKALPFYEKTVSFDIDIPYKLVGWSKSVNLEKEDQKALFEEVETYYQQLSKDFKNKSIENLAKKYYNKEKEVAQAYFHDKKQAKNRWLNDILEVIVNPSAKVMKLEKYHLAFFGNGKVVALMRPPGLSPLTVITKKDNGKSRWSTYDVFLHRPKQGAALEMIR